MSRLVRAVQFLIFSTTTLLGVDPTVVETVRAHVDVPLQTDPAAVFWSAGQPTYLEKDRHGNIAPSFHAEVRTRWTTTSLYFLFYLSVRSTLFEAISNHDPGNQRVVEVGCC